jgi:membrane-associated protein
MHNLIEFITHLGPLAVAAVIFAESGLLIGFFLPGDSLLFMSGFLVQQGTFPINIHLFAVILFVAAVAGDNVGYSFGRKVGRKLFAKPNSKFFKNEYLLQAEAFFKKYGALAIVLARFVPVVRTFTPIVAGVSHMHYKTFFVFNVLGGLIWTAGFTYLGYFVGQKLQAMGLNIEIIALLIIFISVAPIVIHALWTKDKRQFLIEGTRRQLQVLFSKNYRHASDKKRNKK